MIAAKLSKGDIMDSENLVTSAVLAAQKDDRHDGDALHVSDITSCDRKTWARRNDALTKHVSPGMRLKWAAGHAYERVVFEALAAQDPSARHLAR